MAGFTAWDCPCGMRNAAALLACRRCGQRSSDVRVRLIDPAAEVQELACRQSFVGASVAVLILYGLLFFPGLVANRLYLEQAERMETWAGLPLPGVQRLRSLWMTARPLFGITYLVGSLVAALLLFGLQSRRPAPAFPTPPAVRRNAQPAYPPAPVAPHAHATPRVTPQRQRPVAYRLPLPYLPVRAPAPMRIPSMYTSPKPVPDDPPEPAWPRERSPTWVPVLPPVRVVPSDSFDPPAPERAPPPVVRPRAPIALHGTPIGRRTEPLRPPLPLRPIQVPSTQWTPSVRFPRIRR